MPFAHHGGRLAVRRTRAGSAGRDCEALPMRSDRHLTRFLALSMPTTIASSRPSGPAAAGAARVQRLPPAAGAALAPARGRAAEAEAARRAAGRRRRPRRRGRRRRTGGWRWRLEAGRERQPASPASARRSTVKRGAQMGRDRRRRLDPDQLPRLRRLRPAPVVQALRRSQGRPPRQPPAAAQRADDPRPRHRRPAARHQGTGRRPLAEVLRTAGKGRGAARRPANRASSAPTR